MRRRPQGLSGAIVDADIADLRIDPECVDRLLARDGIAEIDGCSDRLGENLRRDQRLPVSSGAERAFVLKDDPQPGDENEDCDDTKIVVGAVRQLGQRTFFSTLISD